jgi:hypothetical protein
MNDIMTTTFMMVETSQKIEISAVDIAGHYLILLNHMPSHTKTKWFFYNCYTNLFVIYSYRWKKTAQLYKSIKVKFYAMMNLA